MIWGWGLAGIFVCVVVILSIKIYLMRKSAKEIREGFADRLITETNNLITISSHDKYMKELAEGINIELCRLRSARHRYQQGDLELKEAVANISHDIRTPLTAICGYLDLLEQEEKTETAERYLQLIENRTEALKQLTEELFRYSLIVSAAQETFCEEVVLNHVLTENIAAYYNALKEAKIVPDIHMPKKMKLNAD